MIQNNTNHFIEGADASKHLKNKIFEQVYYLLRETYLAFLGFVNMNIITETNLYFLFQKGQPLNLNSRQICLLSTLADYTLHTPGTPHKTC